MLNTKIKIYNYKKEFKKYVERCKNQNVENKALILLLASVLIFGFVLPTLLYSDIPYGTDVFTHLIYTKIFSKSSSLSDFYKFCIQHYYKEYRYPFGLWLFGSTVAKLTGLNLLSLAILVPFMTLIVFLIVYYNFSKLFVKDFDKNRIGLLSVLFLLTSPCFCMSILNYSTSVFSMFLVTFVLYLILNEDIGPIRRIALVSVSLFVLLITHTGTYMFMLFLFMSYLIVYSLMTGKIHKMSFFAFALQMTLMISFLGSLFDHIHYQYLDKGRIIMSVGEVLSSATMLPFFKNFSIMLYNEVFLNLNPVFVILWISLLYSMIRVLSYLSSHLSPKVKGVFPALFLNVRHISHGIAYWPVWLGPIHTMFAIVGSTKTNRKGLCLLVAVCLVVVPTGLIAKERALRELHYFYTILPIVSAMGFEFVYQRLREFGKSKAKRILSFVTLTGLFTTMTVIPVIGNTYYHPQISGPKYERDGMRWLGDVGNPKEGAAGLVGSRVAIYGDKIPIAVTSISAGSEAKRFGKDIYEILFNHNSEKFAKDLYTAFGVKYYILTEKIGRVYSLPIDAVVIDENSQIDKIYASENNFGIYSMIAYPTKRESVRSGVEFRNVPTIKDAGTGYLVETGCYKLRLQKENPGIAYLGNKTTDFLGGGEVFDILTLSNPKVNVTNAWILQDQPYTSITLGKNKIVYKTTLRDEETGKPIATLVVKYTFYNRSFRKDVVLINDWINEAADCSYQNQFFTPMNEFDLYLNGHKIKSRTVFPSEDPVTIRDVKYDGLLVYTNKNTRIYVCYEDSAPYPEEISYKGSVTYMYKYYSISSKLRKYLAPGESLHVTQLISIGANATVNTNDYSLTVAQYPYSNVPVVLLCKGELPNVTYTPLTNYSHDLNGYVINGTGFVPSKQRYSLKDLIKLENDGFDYVIAKKIRLPYHIYNREGFRKVQTLCYHGEELNLVLIPISKPIIGEHTKNWKTTLDVLKSAISDGDVVVFLWDVERMRNIDDLMNIVKYIEKRESLELTTPENVVEYWKLLNNVDIFVTDMKDGKRISILNRNDKNVTGFTVKIIAGKISVMGGEVIKKVARPDGYYVYYISTDLKPKETHIITISS